MLGFYGFWCEMKDEGTRCGGRIRAGNNAANFGRGRVNNGRELVERRCTVLVEAAIPDLCHYGDVGCCKLL